MTRKTMGVPEEEEVGGGGSHSGTPGPQPPRTTQQETDDVTRRLDYLRGNTSDVSPYNTRLQNSRIIARKNNEKFVNKQVKERQREISNLLKGAVHKRKSSILIFRMRLPKRHRKKNIHFHLPFLTIIEIFHFYQDIQLNQNRLS